MAPSWSPPRSPHSPWPLASPLLPSRARTSRAPAYCNGPRCPRSPQCSTGQNCRSLQSWRKGEALHSGNLPRREMGDEPTTPLIQQSLLQGTG